MLSATSATITVAVISAPTRSSSSRLVYRGRSSVIVQQRCGAAAAVAVELLDPGRRDHGDRRVARPRTARRSAPARPRRASSSTSMLSMARVSPARSIRVAAGAGIGSPRPTVSSTAASTAASRARRSPARPFLAPGVQQLVLQPEHLPLLGGLGVVVAEQVQHAVHGQQVQFVVQSSGPPARPAPRPPPGRAPRHRAARGRVRPRRAGARCPARPSGSSSRRWGRARPST